MEIDEELHPPEARDAASGLLHSHIREELERILGHREFHATDKMRAFLRFVVEETLAGHKHRIKGYTIATQVFGRGTDFDAGQDPIVSIQAGRLRRALERYYLAAGSRDPVLIDIPKGRYVPRFASLSAHEGDVVVAESAPNSPSSRGARPTAIAAERTGEPVVPRGYRLLSKVGRLPEPVREELVRHFKTLPRMMNASVEQLETVEGIGATRADYLIHYFDRLHTAAESWAPQAL